MKRMFRSSTVLFTLSIVLALAILFLSSCVIVTPGPTATPEPTITSVPTEVSPTPTDQPTSIPPTATEVPTDEPTPTNEPPITPTRIARPGITVLVALRNGTGSSVRIRRCSEYAPQSPVTCPQDKVGTALQWFAPNEKAPGYRVLYYEDANGVLGNEVWVTLDKDGDVSTNGGRWVAVCTNAAPLIAMYPIAYLIPDYADPFLAWSNLYTQSPSLVDQPLYCHYPGG